MASSCWRCTALRRSLVQSTTSPLSRHPPKTLPLLASIDPSRSFHTSSAPSAADTGRPAHRTVRRPALNLSQKKKQIIKPGKKPEIGERKRLRKAVVLSNPNAPVVDVPELTQDTAVDYDAVGKVYSIPVMSLEKLRHLEVFQKRQMWQFFNRPTTFVRDETIELGEVMRWIEDANVEEAPVVEGAVEGAETKKPKTNPPHAGFVITGANGTGKSILLLQSIIFALQRNWIVIAIPNAHDVTIGHTEYEPLPDTKRYIQRVYLQKLLSRIGSANADILASIRTRNTYNLGIEVKAGSSLSEIIDAGNYSPEHSYEAWLALLAELEAPGAPPVLFTMDNLDYAMRFSGYKSPEFEDIHAHNLDLISTFLRYLRGKSKFNRQLVIAATTSELHPNPSLVLTLQRQSLPRIGKYDYRIPQAISRDVGVINLDGLSREHTRSLLEYYKQSGIWDHTWSRTLPLAHSLEKLGISEEDYRLRAGMDAAGLITDSSFELGLEGGSQTASSAPPLGAAAPRAGGGPETRAPALSLEELESQLDEDMAKTNAMGDLLSKLSYKPLTEAEVVEKHVLTGGNPRELLKTCLRTTGSLYMT